MLITLAALICYLCWIEVASFKAQFKFSRNVKSCRISSSSKVDSEDDWPGCYPQHRNKFVPKVVAVKNAFNKAEFEDSELGFQSETFRSGFVSILGNPNVGKSTLMNRLLKENLCIVSPKPQTTRHRILGVLTVDPLDKSTSHQQQKREVNSEFEKNGYQLIFSDTPGMLSPAYKLQKVMQGAVRKCIMHFQFAISVNSRYIIPFF